ncbi:MAG: hypothetical protein JXR26_05340 [Balneolaceae bacterium]|nr:hypothetical protein [Balneolaceae bacterium]
MQKFKYLKEIFKESPWLKEKESKVEELYDLSGGKNLDLVVSLLTRFFNMTREEVKVARQEIISQISNSDNFNSDNTIISALTLDDEPDSGQKIIYDIQIEMGKAGISGYTFRNAMHKTKSYLAKNKSNNYDVILVDEFSGSGSTISSGINDLNGHHNIDNIKVCCYVILEHALETMKDKHPDVEFFMPYILRRGITDFYDESEVDEKIDQMLELEDNLAGSINGKPLSDYSLGYNRAEALFCNESVGGNIPNSVFPLFWWPYDSTNNKRNQLFTRIEDGLW